MINFNCNLSSLNVNISCNEKTARFFKDYMIKTSQKSDICIQTDSAQILNEQSVSQGASKEYCEAVCLYRNLAEVLPNFNRFVFHGAAIKYSDSAYIFTAPSGTGKTTHINLWRKNLGKDVQVINGDKPIISLEGTPTVYGTPFAGKENMHTNTSAPLTAICVIKRADHNKIYRIDSKDAVNLLMQQIYIPKHSVALQQTLSLLSELIEKVPVYILECDVSKNAFTTSFNALTGV